MRTVSFVKERMKWLLNEEGEDLAPAFVLRQLPSLFPDGEWTICFEGDPQNAVHSYLQSIAIPSPAYIEPNTLAPTPALYHIPLTREHMEGLCAQLGETESPFYHLYVYRSIMELYWHDCFYGPFSLADTIDETAVQRFAHTLGTQYREQPD